MIRITQNGTERTIIAAFFMRLPIIKIVKGAKVIWSKISSCFGSGTWVSSTYWLSTDNWKN